MRKLRLPLRRILLSFFFVAATLFGARDLAWADDPVCQVTGVRGAATLEHDGARSALAAGMALAAGDTITTGAGARVKLHFADGSEVRLGENTKLRIDTVKIDAAAGTRTILLSLPLGLLRAAAAKLPQSTGSSFEIHTGIAYSAVRGTHWIVVARNAETRVYVQEGRVAVGADFATNQFPKLIEADRWVAVTRKAGIGAVQVSPAGSVDGLIEQTEASLTPGTPEDEADSVTQAASNGVTGAVGSAVAGTTNAVANAVSNTTETVAGLAGTAVDQTSAAVSATTGAVTSTVTGAVGTVTDTVTGVTGALGLPGGNSSSGTGGSSSSGGSSGSSGSSSGGASGSSSPGSSSSGGSGSSGGASSGSSSSGGSSSSDSSGGSGSSGSSSGSLGGAVHDAVRAVGGLLH